MLNQHLSLIVKRQDREFKLELPQPCGWGELYDVLFEMRSFTVSKINESLNVDKPKEIQEPSKTE